MSSPLSRRSLIVGGFALATISGCKKSDEFACLDTAGLLPDDITTRATLAYVDRSADAERSCKKCQQYVEPKQGCGSCKLFKGGVHPLGSCKAFAAKA